MVVVKKVHCLLVKDDSCDVTSIQFSDDRCPPYGFHFIMALQFRVPDHLRTVPVMCIPYRSYREAPRDVGGDLREPGDPIFPRTFKET